LAPISQSSTIEILKDGDAVALDVLVNPDTHVKIVDLISVSYDYLSLRQEVLSSGPPRDYSLNDVELRMSNYRLLINGELVTSSRPTGGCAGPIIWFYIPGKGRFIFSMAPHEGYDFKKAGTIEHNKIVFNVGSDRYEWVSSSPVVGGGGNWKSMGVAGSKLCFRVSSHQPIRRLKPGPIAHRKMEMGGALQKRENSSEC
jgi:hypothetical protein